MIRGFATNRVLIVVDGVRMNNAIYREGNIQNVISLDPSVIESTEIIFGPGATIYGSDAIGGVMDFHTKKALFYNREKLYIKADAFTRFASANNEKTDHFDLNIGSKKDCISYKYYIFSISAILKWVLRIIRIIYDLNMQTTY